MQADVFKYLVLPLSSKPTDYNLLLNKTEKAANTHNYNRIRGRLYAWKKHNLIIKTAAHSFSVKCWLIKGWNHLSNTYVITCITVITYECKFQASIDLSQGNYGSEGRADHLLIRGLVVWSSTQICKSKCPWARYWTWKCLQYDGYSGSDVKVFPH